MKTLLARAALGTGSRTVWHLACLHPSRSRDEAARHWEGTGIVTCFWLSMTQRWRRCIADNKPRSFDAERAMMLTNMVRLSGLGLGAVWPHLPGQHTLCMCPSVGRHLHSDRQ